MATFLTNLRGPQGPPGPPGPNVTIDASPPADPVIGQLWAQTPGWVLHIWNGVDWQPLSGGGPPPGGLLVAFFADVQTYADTHWTELARHQATAEAMAALGPDLNVFAGDMFTDQGDQAGVDNFHSWFGALRDNGGPSVIRAAAGNHDLNVLDPSSFFAGYWGPAATSSPPHTWADGFLGPAGRLWYSFDLPNGWHGIVLAVAGARWPDPSGTQYQWLVDDLTANWQKPTFVVYHVPRWNVGDYGPSTLSAPAWELYDDFPNVQFVVTGHQHIYQRWHRLNAAGQQPGDGSGVVQYVVPTTGQTRTHTTTPDPNCAAWGTAQNWGFLAVRLYADHWESRLMETPGNPSWGPNIGSDLTTWVSHPVQPGREPSPPEPQIPLIPISDDFTTRQPVWVTGGGVAPDWTGGRVRMIADTRNSSMNTGTTRFDLTGRAVFFHCEPPAASAVRFTEPGFDQGTSDQNIISFRIDASPRAIHFRYRVGSGSTDMTSTTYDPAAMAWLRIRHDGTNVLWETAPAATGPWTVRRQAPPPSYGLTNLRFRINTGATGAVSPPDDYAYYDNLNVLP